MTTVSENFEGQANGTTISTANSALTLVSQTSGAGKFSTTSPLSGTKSLRVTGDGTATPDVYGWSSLSLTALDFDFKIRFNTSVPTSQAIFQARSNGTTANSFGLQLSGSGALQVYDTTGVRKTFTGTLAAGNTYRITGHVEQAAGTATLTVTYYTNGTQTDTWTISTGNTGTGQITSVRTGLLTGSSSNVIDLDDFSYTYTASPPVANAGSDQTVEPGTTVTLDSSGSTDPANGTLTRAWTLVSNTSSRSRSLSSSSAASPTYIAPHDWWTGSVQVWQLVVTSSASGLSSSPDTVQITVYPATVGAVGSGGTVTALQVNPL